MPAIRDTTQAIEGDASCIIVATTPSATAPTITDTIHIPDVFYAGRRTRGKGLIPIVQAAPPAVTPAVLPENPEKRSSAVDILGMPLSSDFSVHSHLIKSQ